MPYKLSNSEIEDKLKEIEQKMLKAYQMENTALLDQLQKYHSIYTDELITRSLEKSYSDEQTNSIVIETEPDFQNIQKDKKTGETKKSSKKFNRKFFK